MAESMISTGYKVLWDEIKEIPLNQGYRVQRGCAAGIGDMLYVAGYKADVYVFNSTTGEWLNRHIRCRVDCFTLASIRNVLVAVGGRCDRTHVVVPDCMSWDEALRSWVSRYPPMPTPREGAVVSSTSNHLIVVGGEDSSYNNLPTTEVMDINTREWLAVADVPCAVAFGSSVVVNETVYVACGSSMYYCSLDTLLQTTPLQEVWKVVTLPPHDGDCLVTVNHKLLSITQSTVYWYREEKKHWSAVANNRHLNGKITAAHLPSGKICIFIYRYSRIYLLVGTLVLVTSEEERLLAGVSMATLAESMTGIDYKLIWDDRMAVPFRTSTLYYSCAATIRNMAYFMAMDVVHMYDSTTGEWLDLPLCGVSLYTLANVQNVLVAVGGRRDGITVPDCVSWDETSRSWISHYPSMPTPRERPAVASTADHLIVAGGFGASREYLPTTEVMDINTREWSAVADLPVSDHVLSAVVCNGTVFVMCEFSICHCSLDTLLQSTLQQKVWKTTKLLKDSDILVTVNSKMLCITLSTAVYLIREKKYWTAVANRLHHITPLAATHLPGGKIVMLVDYRDRSYLLVGELVVVTSEEERHLAAFRAVMAEKGSLEQTIMHCLFIGYPGVGKSSLMKRLRGQPTNPTLPSTGVAEKAVQVEIRRLNTSTAMASRSTSQQDAQSKWCTLSYDDEAIALMASAAQDSSTQHVTLQSEDSSPAMSTLSNECKGDASDQPVLMESSDSAAYADSRSASCTPTSVVTEVEAPSNNSQQVSVAPTISPAPSSTDNVSTHTPPMEVLKQALKKAGIEGSRRYLKRSLTLYLTDTGGQLEFQELVPALTAGPVVFFLVFRLDQDLDKTTSIQFRYPDGHNTESYHTSFTVRETLLQSLASIASMGSHVYSKKQGEQVMLKPKVILIGTHRDKVSLEKIRQIDQSLKSMIKGTSLFREGIIERASPQRLIVAVNNLSKVYEGNAHFQKVRSIIERIADRDDFKVSLPSTWLIFSLVIRQLTKSVITYDECFAIARQCGIDAQDELNEALWFLNTKVGLVRHFRGKGLEDLQDIVIVDPQILFTKITRLIINTFTDHHVTANVSEEFKTKGIFPLRLLGQISNKDDDDRLLTVSRLVKLLEHLHIISRLHNTAEVKYFMPCTLAHAQSTAPELTHSSSAVDYQEIPPLLITFKCGYCPKGLFSALVVYLLANKMKSELNWELQTEHIFRNSISFFIGPHDSISLTLTSTYLKVAMIPDGSRRLSVESVCMEVRRSIEITVREVTSSLHYTSNAEHALAFYCTGKHEAGQERHPAEVVYFQNEPCRVQCTVNMHKERFCLPSGSQCWFGKGLHAGSTRKRKQLTEEWEEEEQAEEGSHPKTARAPLKHGHSPSLPRTQANQKQVTRATCTPGGLAPGGGSSAMGGSVGVVTGGPWGSSGGGVVTGGGGPPQDRAGQRRGQHSYVRTVGPPGQPWTQMVARQSGALHDMYQFGMHQPQIVSVPPSYMYTDTNRVGGPPQCLAGESSQQSSMHSIAPPGLPQSHMLAEQSVLPSHLYMGTSQFSGLSPGGGDAMGGSAGMTRGGPWRSSGVGVVPGSGGAGGGGGYPTPWRGWDGGPPQDRVGQRRSQQSDQQTVGPPGQAHPHVLAGQSDPTLHASMNYGVGYVNPHFSTHHNIMFGPTQGTHGNMGQTPIYPSTPTYQQEPSTEMLPWWQNVNPDLHQHPVQRLAGEPRPVQEPTGLQGWPHQLYSAAHSTGQVFAHNPGLQELLALQGRNGLINIPQQIGLKWKWVGTNLLEDWSGNVVSAIEQQYRGNVEGINTEILQRWIQGWGKADRSWRGLLSVLRVHCVTLADHVEEALASAVMPPPPPPAEQGGQH